MKNRIRTRSFSRACVAALMLLAALAPTDAADAQRISIEGRVWADRDGDGFDPEVHEPPLSGVRVRLFLDGREIGETRTDEAGRYRFKGLETGAYKVAIDESTLPDDLGLGPASFLERSYVDTTRPVANADFGFVPHEVIEQMKILAEEVESADRPSPEEPAAPGALPDPSAVPPVGGGRLETEARVPELVPAERARVGGDEPEKARDAAGVRRGLWILAILVALLLLGLAVRRLVAGPREPTRVEDAESRELAGLAASESRLGELSSADPEAVVDLFLAYRDVQAWSRMDAVYRAMPESMRRMTVIRQQRAFALNRGGDHQAAERLLREQMAEEGASTETCGIMGRVFKDRWEAARVAGDEARATELLADAIEHYLAGHEADPSDPYPGINALTLMEWEASPPARRDTALAEVSRAVADRTAAATPTYWDHATHLELSILRDDEAGARAALAAALAAPKTPWQIETTRRNLRLLREGRERKGQTVPSWAREVEEKLT